MFMHRLIVLALSLSAICVALTSASLAQPKKSKDDVSLLYEVTGKDIKQPSYIFGTFHAICSDDMVPLANLDPYLTRADQVMMEIDMDNTVELQSMAKAAIIADGKTIKDFLTADEFAKVDKMITDLLGYSVENIKMVKPALLTVMALTSPKAIGCKPMTYDVELMRSAVGKKKPIIGLETVASQIAVIDSKPMNEQAKDLVEMAGDPQKSIGELKRMMAAYKMHDTDELYKIAHSNLTKDKEFQTKLLDDRNRAWIPKLEAAFKEKPTFVAVGAGHLGGKIGVIKMLRKEGYQVKAVKL